MNLKLEIFINTFIYYGIRFYITDSIINSNSINLYSTMVVTITSKESWYYFEHYYFNTVL